MSADARKASFSMQTREYSAAYSIASEQGFERMYEEYFSKIYNYIFYRILSREDTEDIVSEVFLKAARNARSFDPKKASLQTWLYTIVKNALTDYYRARKTVLSLEDEVVQVDFEAQLEQITCQQRKEVYRALFQLKERERIVVYCKFFEGYNNRQIAALLDMNESTVGTVLSRALSKLRTPQLRELLE